MGGGLPEFGGENQLFDKIFVENCKKMKVNWTSPAPPPIPPMHLTRFRLIVFAPIRNLGFATDYQVSSITNEKSFKVKLVNLCSMGLMY